MLTIEKVIYNPPATIILWNDGTKTMAKCDKEDAYNKATGFMLCVLKKKYGNKTVRTMFDRYVYDIPPKNSKGVIIVTRNKPKVRKPKVHKQNVKINRPWFYLTYVDDSINDSTDLTKEEYDINDLLNELNKSYELFTI